MILEKNSTAIVLTNLGRQHMRFGSCRMPQSLQVASGANGRHNKSFDVEFAVF